MDALLGGLADEVDPPTTARVGGAARRVHIADSLSGLELACVRSARQIADIGSGAGFPGLVLAAAVPEAHVTLLESTARKCDVIERLIGRAGLANAAAVAVRAEDHARGDAAGTYDLVTARAVGSLALLAEYAAPLLEQGGHLVAWKGRRCADEERAGGIAAAELGLESIEIRRVVPYSEARDHHLHVMRKVTPTPSRYPRRTGAARKRPLA